MDFLLIILMVFLVVVAYDWYICTKFNKHIQEIADKLEKADQEKDAGRLRGYTSNMDSSMIDIKQAIRFIKEDIVNIQHDRVYKVTIDDLDVWRLTDDGKPVCEIDDIISRGRMVKPLALDISRASSIAEEFGGSIQHLHDKSNH